MRRNILTNLLRKMSSSVKLRRCWRHSGVKRLRMAAYGVWVERRRSRSRARTMLVVLLLGFAYPFSAQERPSLRLEIGVAVAAQSADWTTTAIAFRDPDIREGNPVMSGMTLAQMAAVKAGVTALAIWGARSARDHGHPRIAKGLLWLTAGAGGVAASANLRTIWRHR